jgi:hypothetical protein
VQYRPGLLAAFLAKIPLDFNSAYDIIFRISCRPRRPPACKLHGIFHRMIPRHFPVSMQ